MSTHSSDSSRSSSSDSAFRSLYPSNSSESSAPTSPCLPTAPIVPTVTDLNLQQPSYILLPSPAFANNAFLHDLTSTLEKGAGDLVVLCVDNVRDIEMKKISLERAMKAINVDIDSDDRVWVKVMGAVDGECIEFECACLMLSLLTASCQT